MSLAKIKTLHSRKYDMKVRSGENRGNLTLTTDAYFNKIALRFPEVNT